jgi:hypothetical protein
MSATRNVNVERPSGHRQRDLGRDALGQRARIDRLRPEGERAGTRAGGEQEIVDQPAQAAGMRSHEAERARPNLRVLGMLERELSEAEDRRHRRLQLVRNDREEALAVAILRGNGGEAGVECVGEDGDFVAPLFEHAFVNAEVLESLHFLHETTNARRDRLVHVHAEREGPGEAEKAYQEHPPRRVAAPPLDGRVLHVDERHVHTQELAQRRSQIPRVVFDARGGVAVRADRGQLRVDSFEDASDVVRGGALLGDELTPLRPVEIRAEAERVVGHVFGDRPFGPVALEEVTDVARPVRHERHVGRALRRGLGGQLQLRSVLHRFGDALDGREHVAVHEGEVRREAVISRERDSEECRRRRDLHGDERAQTFSDGDSRCRRTLAARGATHRRTENGEAPAGKARRPNIGNI